MEQALNDAVTAAGGQAPLGREIGVSQPSVWHWVNKSRRCAAEYVLKVEASTGVSRHRLRPDLYPPDISNQVDVDAARTVLCSVCELRTDDPAVRGCTAMDCPHSERLTDLVAPAAPIVTNGKMAA